MVAALAAEFGAERFNLIFGQLVSQTLPLLVISQTPNGKGWLRWLDGGGRGFEFNYTACHSILWWFGFAASVQPGAICLPVLCGLIRRPTWVP